MNAIAVQKSRGANWREGFVLSTMLALPAFAGAAMLLKLAGSSVIVGGAGGAAFFVAATSLLSAFAATWLGPKYPRFFQTSYEPIFFDPTLGLREKLSCWMAQPKAQHHLLATLLMLAVLGTALASMR